MIIILRVNVSILIKASKRSTISNQNDWVSCLSRLSVLQSVIFEHLGIRHNWISWFEWFNPITWFNLISSILWSDLISLIYWFCLINLNQLLFPSSPCGILRKTLPIIWRRIRLVRPKSYTKYTRTVHTYINGICIYGKPT